MTKKRLLALTIAFLAPLIAARAESVIRKSCPLARQVSIVSSPSGFKDAVCSLREVYPGSTEVKSLADDVLSSVSKLKSDPALDTALEKLSTALNKTDRKVASSRSTPLSLAMKSLVDKWGDSKVRSNPANRNAYINDLNHILQQTKAGRDVLNCFAQAKGPLISGEQIIDFPEEHKAKGIAMSFDLVEDPENPGKYIKTIYFNAEHSPIMALILYAHEMKHGCNSNVIAQNDEKLKDPSQDFTKIYQNRAVDEIRAYRVSVEFFKELAQEAPDLVCNNYSTSTIFGRQVLSSAEYNAKLDEMYQDGTFPQYLISKYSAMGSIPAKYVFKTGKIGKQTKSLRDDLIQSLKAEGFSVSQ